MLKKLKLINHILVLFAAFAIPTLAVLTLALLATEKLTEKLQQLGKEDLPLTQIIANVAREQLGQSLHFNEVLLHARTGHREKFEIANDAFSQYGKRISDSLLEGRNTTQRGLEQNSHPGRTRELDAVKTIFKEIEKVHGDYEHIGASLIRNIYQYEFLFKPDLMKAGDHLSIEEEETKQVESISKSLSELEDETNRLENKIKDGIEKIEGLSANLAADYTDNRALVYKTLVSMVFVTLVGVFLLGMAIGRIHEKRREIQENKLRQIVNRVSSSVGKIIPATQKIESVGNYLMEQQSRHGQIFGKTGDDLNKISDILRGNIQTTEKTIELNDHKKLIDHTQQNLTVFGNNTLDALTTSRETVKIIALLKNRLLQVNILATNASAESARNEATQGLSVFTTEIRENAKKCAEDAEFVAELLEKFHNKVQTDTEIMKYLRNNVDDLIRFAIHLLQVVTELKVPIEKQTRMIDDMYAYITIADGNLKNGHSNVEEFMLAKQLLIEQAGLIQSTMEQWPEFAADRRSTVPPLMVENSRIL